MQMALLSGTPAFSVRPPTPAARTFACACAPAGRAGAGAGAGAGAAKWAAPVLGWSGQPDYIDARPAPAPSSEEEKKEPRGSAAARRRGVLTEDKARRLRMQMMETGSYHDVMYHSAIASRLASAAPGKR